MRLLLLLSALLTALTGVAGGRASAQPVQVSAAAVAPVATAAMPSRLAARFAGAAFGGVPPVQPPLPRLLGGVARRLLYAERRRE